MVKQVGGLKQTGVMLNWWKDVFNAGLATVSSTNTRVSNRNSNQLFLICAELCGMARSIQISQLRALALETLTHTNELLIYLTSLCVCLYPINVLTAEPIWP